MLNSLLSLLPALIHVFSSRRQFFLRNLLGKKALLCLPRACSNDFSDTEFASLMECETNMSLKDKCHFSGFVKYSLRGACTSLSRKYIYILEGSCEDLLLDVTRVNNSKSSGCDSKTTEVGSA